jgi:hypothetical protein
MPVLVGFLPAPGMTSLHSSSRGHAAHVQEQR